MYSYDTVTEALADLKTRGYTYDFNLRQNRLYCVQQRKYEMLEAEIEETYRFEGNTDPADEAVVHALVTKDGQRGTFVNGYGPSADPESEDLLRSFGDYA